MKTFRQILEGYVEDNLRNELPDDASSVGKNVHTLIMRVKNIAVGTETHDSAGSCCTFDERKAKWIGEVQEFHRVNAPSGEWWESGERYYHESWLEPVE